MGKGMGVGGPLTGVMGGVGGDIKGIYLIVCLREWGEDGWVVSGLKVCRVSGLNVQGQDDKPLRSCLLLLSLIPWLHRPSVMALSSPEPLWSQTSS